MGRLLVSSDWHGMLDEVKKLLEKSKYAPGVDELVVLGDWVDRGPYPIDTLKFMIQLTNEGNGMVHPIIGNHEDMFIELIQALENGYDAERFFREDTNGTKVTYDQFQRLLYYDGLNLIRFIRRLPLSMTKEGLFFVHGSLNPFVSMEAQTRHDMLHVYGRAREIFLTNPVPCEEVVVFGHTITSFNNYKIWQDPVHADKIDVDCGGVFGGNLAMLSFEMENGKYKYGEEFYVPCEKKWGK